MTPEELASLKERAAHGFWRLSSDDFNRLMESAEAAASLVQEVQNLRGYLREKNEIIKAYAGPAGMTPEDVAFALAMARTSKR